MKLINVSGNGYAAAGAEPVLASCESTEIVFWAEPTPGPQVDDALVRYDDNGNGRISCAEARAHGIMAGTVLAPGIWWNKHSADGRNVNQLTPQDETDMGASASFYDVRVFVEVA